MRRPQHAPPTIAARNDGYDEAIAVLRAIVAAAGGTRWVGHGHYRLLPVYVDNPSPQQVGDGDIDVLYKVGDYSIGGALDWPERDGAEARSVTHCFRALVPTYDDLILASTHRDYWHRKSVMYGGATEYGAPATTRRRLVVNDLDTLFRSSVAAVIRRGSDEPALQAVAAADLFGLDIRQGLVALKRPAAPTEWAARYQIYQQAESLHRAIDSGVIAMAQRMVDRLEVDFVRDPATRQRAREAGYALEAFTVRRNGRTAQESLLTRAGVLVTPVTNDGSASPPLALDAARTMIREISTILGPPQRHGTGRHLS